MVRSARLLILDWVIVQSAEYGHTFWTHLEMWDNGLDGRFCLKCFDYVVHAKDLLRSQALRKLKKSRKVFAEYEIHRCITLMV